jgi:hypothetical protein
MNRFLHPPARASVAAYIHQPIQRREIEKQRLNGGQTEVTQVKHQITFAAIDHTRIGAETWVEERRPAHLQQIAIRPW